MGLSGNLAKGIRWFERRAVVGLLIAIYCYLFISGEFETWRWPALAAIATAAAVVAITLSVSRLHRPDLAAPPSAARADIDILRNLEMLEDYEVVSRLDAREDFDVVADLDELLAAEEQDGEGR